MQDRVGRVIFWSVIVVIVVGFVGSFRTKAHEAKSGWSYPRECCSNGDCAEATKIEYLEGNVMRVTTKHGTALYESSFPRRISPDTEVHACHLNGTKYCLFVPAGI